MASRLETAGIIIGAVGGLFGMYAGYVTLWRDRARIRVDVERHYTMRGMIDADHFSDPIDRDKPTEFVVVTVRNVGNRSVRLEKFLKYFAENDGPGRITGEIPLKDLLLNEERRRYTYAIDLTYKPPGDLIAVGVRDDLGKDYIAYVPESRADRIRAWWKVRHQRSWKKQFMRGNLRTLEEEQQRRRATKATPN